MSGKIRLPIGALLAVVLLIITPVVTPIASLLFSSTAYASGEQFEYDGPYNGDTPPGAIIVSGGTNNLPPIKLTRQENTNNYTGFIKIGAQCNYKYTIDVTDNNRNTGRVTENLLTGKANPVTDAACDGKPGLRPQSGNLSIANFGEGATTKPSCDPSPPYVYNATSKSCRAPQNSDGTCPNGGTPVDPNTNGGKKECDKPANSPAAGPSTADDVQPDPCPIVESTALRWLICPVFELINWMLGGLDSFIESYLATGTDMFEPTHPAYPGYRKAWETFRIFGISLVLVLGLFMILSEAMGLGIFDAYTIRKMLPRVIIAVIGISISWDLLKFLITIFDDMGYAMQSIVYSSFGAPSGGISISEMLLTSYFITPGVIGAAWLLLTPFGMLSLLGTLGLAMLMAALLLVVRQGIIVALFITSGLWMAAYASDKTSKVCTFCWSTDWKALVLFPAAMFVISFFKALGNLLMTVDKPFAVVTGVTCFVVGYGFCAGLPQVIGGGFATIAGKFNDRTKGGFDRLKNYRAGKAADNWERIKEGRRFDSNSNRFAKKFNDSTRTAAAFGASERKWSYLTDKQSREKSNQQFEAIQAAKFAKTDEFSAMSENDPVLRSLALGSEDYTRKHMARIFSLYEENKQGTGQFDKVVDEETGEASYVRNLDGKGQYDYDQDQVEDAIKSTLQRGGYSRARQLQAAKQLYNTGTGYENAQQALEVGTLVAGTNTEMANDIFGYGNYATAKANRLDLKAGHGTYMDNYNKMAKQVANGQIPTMSAEARLEFEVKAAGGNNAVDVLRGKETGVKNITNALHKQLRKVQIDADTAAANGDDAKFEEMNHEAARLTGIIDTYGMQGKQYAAPNVRRVVMKQVIQPTSGAPIEVPFGPPIPAPTVGNREVVYASTQKEVKDAKGLPVTNPNYSKAAKEGYAEQAPPRGFDPTDPDSPYNRRD